MTKKINKYGKTIVIIVGIILVISLLSVLLIDKQAENKGINYLKSSYKYSTIDKLKINVKTPNEDTLPKTLNNKFIYVYQYGCKDCYENNEKIKEIFKKEKIKPYNIPYGSKELDRLEGIEVKEVPFLIYVDYNGEIFYTQMAENEAGETRLLKENIDKLIKSYKLDNNIDIDKE